MLGITLRNALTTLDRKVLNMLDSKAEDIAGWETVTAHMEVGMKESAEGDVVHRETLAVVIAGGIVFIE